MKPKARSRAAGVSQAQMAGLLQVDVDVVGADSLRGTVRDRILREAVPP